MLRNGRISSLSGRSSLQSSPLAASVEVGIRLLLIGRAKRAPHWGVQSRFRVIYIIVCLRLSMGKQYKKIVAKNAWVELRSPNTRMLKVSFRSLKQCADYNFRLESLILPSSGRLKPTRDTSIIHFYYTLEQLQHGWKKHNKRSLRNEKLKSKQSF